MTPNPWIEQIPIYEPGRPIEEVAREIGISDPSLLIKTASNENELGPSPKAVAAMQQSAAQMHRYPDGAAFDIKHKLAYLHSLSPHHIALGNGSNELIVLLGHILLNPESHLVMSEYAFVVYRLIGALFNASVTQIPMIDFTHDLNAMAKAIQPNTKIMAVCNPNNPTGTAVAPQQLLEFIKSIPSHILIIIDEAYIELMPEAQTPKLTSLIQQGQENLVLLRTFSKAYGLAGLRIGYAMAHPQIIKWINHVRQPFNLNAMAQAAAIAALDDHEHLNQSRSLTQRGRDQLEAGLRQLQIPFVPSCANFILIHTGDARACCQFLLGQCVIARPMNGYQLPEWIRLTVGTDEQNVKILKALEAWKEASAA